MVTSYRHGSACGRRAAVRFFYLSHGLVPVCEIELAGNPDLVCEKLVIITYFL